MAAALCASDAGADVVIFEQRSVLGGLTSSIRRNGLSFDNGQHVFMRCCSAYREFIERIGATSQVYLQRRLEVPVLAPGGRCASIKRTALPAPAHVAMSLARYRHVSLRDRLRLVRPALALKKLDLSDPSLDKISFGQWLARYGQSEAALARVWNLIALPTLNVPAGEASLALVAKVFRTGMLDRVDAGDMGWSKIPLGELHGGFGGRALSAAGVELALGGRVTSIEQVAGGTVVIGSGERQEVVDALVVATPPKQAAKLGAFGGDPDRLGTSPIVNVHIVWDRRVTDLALAACVESPIQFVFDHTAAAGLRSGQCLTISLSAADAYLHQGSSQLVAIFVEAVREMFAPAANARVLDALVTREKAATFRAVPGTGPLRPGARTAIPGVFLAGAWCDTGWPATMEGAVASGRRAASEAMDFISGTAVHDCRYVEGVRR
jgi:squalene-associated FAD-dependent desaturase